MMHSRWFATLAIALLLMHPWLVYAECGKVTPQPGPYGYQSRSDSDRCEGLYVAPSAGGFELVSLTRGRVTFGSTSSLLIDPLNSPAGARLVGLGIRPGLNYRMDAPAGVGVLRLPLDVVIRPAGIVANELGLFAVRSLPGGQLGYLPVHVRGTPENGASGDVLAVFRADTDVRSVSVRLRRAGVSGGGYALVAGTESGISAGHRIDIPLQLPSDAGLFVLDVSYFDRWAERERFAAFTLLPR